MLRRLEALLDPTAGTPASPPTAGLVRFYWFYIRQVTGLTAALFVFGGLTAILDSMIPAFIGRVVGLVSSHTPQTLFRDSGLTLLGMAGVLMVLRPLSLISHSILVNQIVNPGLSNMMRWQNHWHVVRQSWTFFQNDFAGRIANRVLQTGPALRESLVMAFDAAWYIVVYGSTALVLLGRLDWRLTLPLRGLVCDLRRHAALFRAAPAGSIAPRVGDALESDRARGGQLYQHPDGEAVRTRGR